MRWKEEKGKEEVVEEEDGGSSLLMDGWVVLVKDGICRELQ